MFNFGIRKVMVGLACPGARRIVAIDMVDGSLGLMHPDGTIEWVLTRGRGYSMATNTHDGPRSA